MGKRVHHSLRTYNISQVELGDPTYVRVQFRDFDLISPEAKEWMLARLRAPMGIAEVTDLTLLNDGIVFELKSKVATRDQAKEVCSQVMGVLIVACDRLEFDEYVELCNGKPFDPTAVSSVDTRGPASSWRG
jgi:hypothetical protein